MEKLCDNVQTEDLLQTLRDSDIPTLELHYKRKAGHLAQPVITTAAAAYQYLLRSWDTDKIDLCEQFKVLLLDRASRPLGVSLIAQGTSNEVCVSTTFIFGLAILAKAGNLIVAHNHPSGSLQPSKADEILTKRIQELGQLHDIKLLDHLIITAEGYYSFANERLL